MRSERTQALRIAGTRAPWALKGMTTMTAYERRLADEEEAQPIPVRPTSRERAAAMSEQLAERADELRQKVEQRGEVVIEQTRQFIIEHPRQAIAGVAIASYIAGKLLRGRTNQAEED